MMFLQIGQQNFRIVKDCGEHPLTFFAATLNVLFVGMAYAKNMSLVIQ